MKKAGEDEFRFEEEEKGSGSPSPMMKSPSSPNNALEILGLTKWPTRLLSIIHPFNVELNLDDCLERILGLNLPFLDFRVGVQGADESFSFIISREDEDFHAERTNLNKLFRMLWLS